MNFPCLTLHCAIDRPPPPPNHVHGPDQFRQRDDIRHRFGANAPHPTDENTRQDVVRHLDGEKSKSCASTAASTTSRRWVYRPTPYRSRVDSAAPVSDP